MGYPQEFVERVKKAYPKAKRLHQALDADRDDGTVSLALSWTGDGPATVKAEILLKAKSLDEVYELARKAIEREEIWAEYRANHRKWFRK